MALAHTQLRCLAYQGIRCSAASFESSQHRHGSTVEITKSTNTAALRRGTGGRSSFNGVVATVFGCSGFLGRYVCNQLGKIGSQVILPYRGDHGEVLRLKLVGDLGQVLFFPFYLKDEETLYRAMKYSNVVINLVGRMNQTSNFSFEDVHVTGARNIARIAKECGVKRLIHVSALNAAENPTSVILKGGSKFLASKWRGEQAVREEFPEATIFRPATIWGEEDKFLNLYGSYWRAGSNWKTIALLNKGKGIFKQPVFVADVAKAIVNSIFEESAVGETYEAVGPRRYELHDLVNWFLLTMVKEECYGYKITDLRYSPYFWLKLMVIEKLWLKNPKLCMEKLEMEHLTEVLTRGLPNLEDLGVKLTNIEDVAPVFLRLYRSYSMYEDDYGEFPPPPPPKIVLE